MHFCITTIYNFLVIHWLYIFKIGIINTYLFIAGFKYVVYLTHLYPLTVFSLVWTFAHNLSICLQSHCIYLSQSYSTFYIIYVSFLLYICPCFYWDFCGGFVSGSVGNKNMYYNDNMLVKTSNLIACIQYVILMLLFSHGCVRI